ncbi:NAD(P)-dependent oxidoreductase [Methylobacterium sp. R2-1]|uniref:NAD-dependent epimerase/dehydratase family protein n=1 Tax=Methylobacterium sp. R2-1 TaxID=2587064 RepID=UPI00161724A0|nr:NAD-dependent epimerase/dehydratase family protein [Methylobacterium sp. R2-1]MBB2961775.1 UDP-glucose 4-epimerase [Methylobacterium sp. R2-1]
MAAPLSFNGVRVLITGGSGFLGQHLVRALIPLGAEIVVLKRDPEADRRSDVRGGELERAGRITLLRGDLLDEVAVVRAATGADIVFHLAGRGGGGGSFRDFTDANVTGTCNVLTACAAQTVARLVFVSSAAVYGTGLQIALDESHPPRGRSIYAASKIAAEALVAAYVATGRWAVTLRPSNIYGPDQMTDTVVTTLLRQLGRSDEIVLRALHPVRDYIYVQDAVDALLAAALRPDLPPGRTLNVSSGAGYSVRQLAEAAVAAVRRSEPDRRVTVRPVEEPSGAASDHLVCDNNAARIALDWAPRIDLVDGLEASYALRIGRS